MKFLKKYRLFLFTALIVTVATLVYKSERTEDIINYIEPKVSPSRTVEDVLNTYEKDVLERFSSHEFISKNGFPKKLLIYADKSEEKMSVYGRMDKSEKFVHIKTYDFKMLSGKLGPKLRQGDRQVPEGLYQMENLNPNSICHLSFRVSYPNDFDKKMSKTDGRKNTDLGGDIMIHGGFASVGCIPIGNYFIEEVFVFAAKAGVGNVEIVITPFNILKNSDYNLKNIEAPSWYPELIAKIKKRMHELKNEGANF